MRVVVSQRAAEQLAAAPDNVARIFFKQLAHLLRDRNHPSLDAKKYPVRPSICNWAILPLVEPVEADMIRHMTNKSFFTTAIGLAPILLASAILALGSSACGSRRGSQLQPLQRRIDLQRFMGKWYVLAHIPIDNVFASEANAYDAIEEYELAEDGSIPTTFTFREGSFDGPQRVMRPTGFVHDEQTNAEWRMQFIWPFKSPYLIVYLDDDYETTIIGVPDRSHAWMMARTPSIPDAEYDDLVGELARMGHDLSKLRKVPQSPR